MASSPFEGQLNTLYRPNAAHHCMMMVEGAFGLLWDINGLMGGREGMTMAVVLFDEVCYRACVPAQCKCHALQVGCISAMWFPTDIVISAALLSCYRPATTPYLVCLLLKSIRGSHAFGSTMFLHNT